jgi:CBS domain-containing protein
MTREVILVSDTTELASVAVLLETNGIKRLSVLKDGKLVGIVSRANLVRALAAADPNLKKRRRGDPQSGAGRGDPQTLARRIEQDGMGENDLGRRYHRQGPEGASLVLG